MDAISFGIPSWDSPPPSPAFNVSEQTWWNKVVKVIQICFSCSMLCMDGLLLYLVGKRQLLVYSGAPYGNSKLGDSIGESPKSS